MPHHIGQNPAFSKPRRREIVEAGGGAWRHAEGGQE